MKKIGSLHNPISSHLKPNPCWLLGPSDWIIYEEHREMSAPRTAPCEAAHQSAPWTAAVIHLAHNVLSKKDSVRFRIYVSGFEHFVPAIYQSNLIKSRTEGGADQKEESLVLDLLHCAPDRRRRRCSRPAGRRTRRRRLINGPPASVCQRWTGLSSAFPQPFLPMLIEALSPVAGTESSGGSKAELAQQRTESPVL
ncbi:hypothetical protein EYF80_033112 [Liparis tanakae]|uniref:Uncharacterized protein n=1 Tax=Liparis tanakae TaxID=230148 RepID=A0A4Z2GU66_9TELE|nr:hypothetical protein EYF80_033112 [Liparis tanakae]